MFLKALRILLQFISATAARHGMRMKPIMAINFDFYVRVFVVLEKGKDKANDSVRFVLYFTELPKTLKT